MYQIKDIIHRLLNHLYETEQLLIFENYSIEELSQDIINSMSQNKQEFAQFGSWLSQTLLQHPKVDELFATDEELNELLRDIYSITK